MKRLAGWTAVLILTVAVRLILWPVVFGSGQVLYHANDPYYLLRLAFYLYENFPRYLLLDPFAGYPEGFVHHFPPLMPALAAVPVLATGLPPEGNVKIVAAFIPVFMGLLSVMAFHFLAKRIVSEPAAWIGTVLVALNPRHMFVTMVGDYDTAGAEVFFFPVILLFFLAMVRTERISQTWTIAGGILLSLAMLTWTGALAFIGVGLFALEIGRWVEAWRKDGTSSFHPAWYSPAIALLIAVILLAFPVSQTYRGARWEFDLYSLSWFQWTLLLLFAAMQSSGVWITNHVRGSIVKRLLSSWGLQAAVLILAILLIHPLWDSLKEGLGFFYRADPWFADNMEFKPMLVAAPLSRWICWLSPGWLISPLLILLLLHESIKNRHNILARSLFSIWAVVVLAAALSEQRFGIHAAMAVSILNGWLIAVTAERLSKYRPPLRIPALILGALLFMAPGLTLFPYLKSGFDTPPPQELEAFRWIREHTPAQPDLNNPDAHPTYSVLCHWDKGHLIQYYTGRAVVGNPITTNRLGNARSSEFLFADSEEKALAVMKDAGARYYLGYLNSIFVLDEHALTVGLEPTDYIIRKQGPMDLTEAHFTPNTLKLACVRLHRWDGCDVASPERSLSHFRLIYESKPFDVGGGEFLADIKLFERVPGAVLTGKSSAGDRILVTALIQTNQDRRFTFVTEGKANENGDYQVVFPYATESSPLTECVAEVIELNTSTENLIIELSEQDVLEGRTINIHQ